MISPRVRPVKFPMRESKITLGSSPLNDITLPDREVDSFQLLFGTANHLCYVVVIGRAKAWLNGKMLRRGAYIQDNDVIQVGKHKILFRYTPK